MGVECCVSVCGVYERERERERGREGVVFVKRIKQIMLSELTTELEHGKRK